MKTINNYILEKFKISKDIKDAFSPDKMVEQNILIYSDEPDDEGENQADEEYLNSVLEKLDLKYSAFICFRDEISTSKDLDRDYVALDKDIFEVYEKVVTGHDLGYEISLNNGRLKIVAMNSGSRSSYYIYAVTKKGLDIFLDWENGDIEDTLIFFNSENFEEIKDDVALL